MNKIRQGYEQKQLPSLLKLIPKEIKIIVKFHLFIPFSTNLNYHMLKPKLTPYYPFSIAISNPHQPKSTHKIDVKPFLTSMNNHSLIPCNDNLTPKQTQLQNIQLHPKPTNFQHKILTLDHALFHNASPSKAINKPPKQTHGPSSKKIPTNPFEQILNETSTPDFNSSLPFTDQFSQIDLKSPTFSDIFAVSQIKSPQVKNQKPHFFMTTKKKTHDPKQNLNKTVKVDQSYKKEHNEEEFLQKMERCIKQMKTQQLPFNKEPKTAKHKCLNENSGFGKLTAGFGLKNHFSRSTPKISKLPSSIYYETKTLQKDQYEHNYISKQSNPQEEGKIVNPIAIAYPKSPRIYKFSDNSNTKRQNEQNKQNKQNQEDQSKHKGDDKNKFFYKMTFPVKDIKTEMEQIYNGKFKIQQSARY